MKFELLADSIKQINEKASSAAKSAVNQLMTLRNWAIGYYIVEYGLNEAATKELSDKYKKYLHDYDFSGLVEEKLKDSENKIAGVKKFNHLLHMCLLFVNACMIMTVLIIAVIIYL